MRILISIIVGLVFSFCVLNAQTGQVTDSAAVENALLIKYHSLYGNEWSKQFVESWNANKDTAKVLGGLGSVYFVATGKETTAVLMSFDSSGFVTYKTNSHPASTDTTPRFTATLTRWAEFMEGKFHAVAGVLSQKIQYKGPMMVAFKYGFYFDKVAPVGRRVVESLNEKGTEETSTKKKTTSPKKIKGK